MQYPRCPLYYCRSVAINFFIWPDYPIAKFCRQLRMAPLSCHRRRIQDCNCNLSTIITNYFYWDTMHTSHLWRDSSSDYNCYCGECIGHFVNLNLNFAFWFSVLNKNDNCLYPCNTIPLSTDFCNIYLVFFTYFDRFWSRRASVEAPATTTTITSPSTATVAAIPSVTHLVHVLKGSRLI
jgi:hypothetical protein